MAISSGDMRLVQWLYDNNKIKWSPWLCACAARYGHFDLLIWCRNHNCPWDSETCSSAARGGYFEVLKYARSNGCQWNSDTFNYARHYHHDNGEMFKWICDNKCPTDKNDSGLKCTCNDLSCQNK
jgi:hypothetical protein